MKWKVEIDGEIIDTSRWSDTAVENEFYSWNLNEQVFDYERLYENLKYKAWLKIFLKLYKNKQ